MKNYVLLFLLIIAACNPELKNIGADPDDLVKYFKLTKSGENSLGEGILIVAHIGDKKLLTFYLKQPSGKYSHTDVMIKPEAPSFAVESVYSQTPDCKLNPDYVQPQYFEELVIETVKKSYNREILTREEAMSSLTGIGC